MDPQEYNSIAQALLQGLMRYAPLLVWHIEQYDECMRRNRHGLKEVFFVKCWCTINGQSFGASQMVSNTILEACKASLPERIGKRVMALFADEALRWRPS